MTIRASTYNIEWFADLFDDNNQPLTDKKSRKRLSAIKTVLTTVDADVFGIVEAPNTTTTTGQRSTTRALENFAAAKHLRLDKAMIGFPSAGRQELALWYDSSKLSLVHEPGGSQTSKTNPPFDSPFRQDTDEDRVKEIYKHYRPPLEAKAKMRGGAEFHILLVHAKSKGIFRAVDLVRLQRESERNRRKLLAEALSIRRRVDDWLAGGRDFLVMGDVNDGPGMDFYEQLFGRSALEIIMGDVFQPDKILLNPAGRPRWGNWGWRPSSARFRDRITEDHINVLIDHILHSPGLKASGHRIWNPFELKEAKPIKSELLRASDHFPVSLDLY